MGRAGKCPAANAFHLAELVVLLWDVYKYDTRECMEFCVPGVASTRLALTKTSHTQGFGYALVAGYLVAVSVSK